MDGERIRTLSRLMVQCAATLPAAQRGLDAAVEADWTRAEPALRALAGTLPPSLLAMLAPVRLRVAEGAVHARFLASATRSRGAGLGLSIMGRPIHSFLEVRYRRSVEQAVRLSVSVEGRPGPGNSDDEAAGDRDG